MTYIHGTKLRLRGKRTIFYAVREIFLHLFVIFYAAILNQSRN